MIDINAVFEGNSYKQRTQIIKECDINTLQHSRQLSKFIKAVQPNFRATPENEKVFKQLFEYFTGKNNLKSIDGNKKEVSELKLEPLSPNKGIWLVGQVGSGKSLLMDVFKAYTGERLRANSFASYEFEKIVKNYITEGEKALSEFAETKGDSSGTSKGAVIHSKPVYVDDFMNVKFEVKSWGELGNVAESIINTRYRVFSKNRKLTHVSTNIYPNQLGTKPEQTADSFEITNTKFFGLDERVVSRCKEMFNIVVLNGMDFRGL